MRLQELLENTTATTVAKTWDQMTPREKSSGVKGRTVWNSRTQKYYTVFDVPATAKGTDDIKEAAVPFDQCPGCGGQIVHESLLSEKQDACYHKVKSRYKVWPSAYASGALVQCRKKGAANWGNKTESTEQVDEDLKTWFKDKWVRFGPDGKIKGDCARDSESEGKPKCLPQSKAQALGKKGRASAGARKRRQDPDADRSGTAINVATKKKSNEGVATGLSSRDKKDVEAIRAAIAGLRAQLDHPGVDKAAIQSRITQERKRLALYGQDLAEAGPFSYGATTPRPGSVADLAAKKRQEQDRKTLVIEPADQMFGVARMIKDIAMSNAAPEHKKAAIDALNKKAVAETASDSGKSYGVRYKVFAGREGRLTTKEYWTTSSDKLERAVAKIQDLGNFYAIDGYSYPEEQQGVSEEWSQKYKSSINCAKPKGFSQQAHCAGKKKTESVTENLSELKIAALEKQYNNLKDALGLARERRKAKGQHVQSPREMQLATKMSAAYDLLSRAK